MELQEVLVTGSHIRGVENLSSPIIRFDRDAIERSGYATTQQLIQSLPQNLNNISDTTFSVINGGLEYGFGGSGVNLRGLGGASTLVLLNGRRMAAAGKGDFVDLSLIPLSAIERMDVLTDGASAIYGSDAVGGVVNLVLRKDFQGPETRLRYSTVTQGSHDETQAGQLLGHSWGSGQALVSYEYHRRSSLDDGDRDFVEPREGFTAIDLIPAQKRHGAFAMLSQRLGDAMEISGDLFFGQREGSYRYGSPVPFPSAHIESEVQQYGASLALTADLSVDWQLRVSGLADRNTSEEQTYEPSTGGLMADYSNASRLWSAEIAADGPLFSLPGGEARLAVGAQFRNEHFDERQKPINAQRDRDISATYAELRLPLVSVFNRRTGVENLELTVAARFEDYSDFGSTFNPKIGLAWSPVERLNVRGTWGTSFKAPLLSQTNPANFFVYSHEETFVDHSGVATGLLLWGNGENLEPEEATNWTVGFDVTPAGRDGIRLSATYFDIDYEQRLSAPFSGGYEYFSNVLTDPYYAQVVTRNPDPGQLAALIGNATRTICYTATWATCTNMTPIDQFDVIVDGRLRNLAGVRMSGIDFSAGYQWSSALGDWSVEFGGSKLLRNDEQLLPGHPATEQLDDVWRPVVLRLRNSVSYARGAFQATAFVKYTDGYSDRRTTYVGSTRRSKIASWTTVDVTVQYDLENILSPGMLPEAALSLSAINLFDKDPPFISSPYGIHFDGVNATPLGRFVGLQVTVRW